ncbi:MAG: hypothetical protein PUB23_00505, partial [Bacilli bacterium]|nr:hypothetical protein [Bacilli bacterium]
HCLIPTIKAGDLFSLLYQSSNSLSIFLLKYIINSLLTKFGATFYIKFTKFGASFVVFITKFGASFVVILTKFGATFKKLL